MFGHVKLTTQPPLVARIIINRAVALSLCLCGVILNSHRDNSAFSFTYELKKMK